MSRTKKARIIVAIPHDEEIIKQVMLDLEAAGFEAPVDQYDLAAHHYVKYDVEYEYES